MGDGIHPTAVVSPLANLGSGNTVGPFAVIESGVTLGDNNQLGAHCVLKSGTRMGNANVVAEHAVLGGTPQDLGFDSATETFVNIGDENTFREFVTIHRASKEGQATRLGDGNFLMNGVHIAHDCGLGDNIVLAPYAAIGGHVHIEDRAFISGGVMIHQFTKVGCFAMIGGNSKITQDVLPYMITDGVPGQVKGLNKVGLRRAGVSPDEMRVLKQAYQLLFHAVRPKEAIVKELSAVDSEHCRHLAGFIRSSRRGYHRV